MADDPSDDDLFRAFQRGDRAAFEVLAQRCEASMLGLARGLLDGDSSSACDAVQNAWIRIIRSAGAFRGESTFKTWAYRILVNECRRMRSAMKRSAMSVETSQSVSSEPCEGGLRIEESDELAMIRAAVDRLPAATREAVLICFHHGMTHAAAAEVLEVPLGTLKTRVRSALYELRSALSTEPAR